MKTIQAEETRVDSMLTVRNVAGIFGVHPRTINGWVDRGILKFHRYGSKGEPRFKREDVAVLYLEKAIEKYLKNSSIHA